MDDARRRSWRIGGKPIIAEPCRCSTPAYYRDAELGVRCGKRRRSRSGI